MTSDFKLFIAMMLFICIVGIIGLVLQKTEQKRICSTCGHRDFRHTQIGCVLCRCPQFTQKRSLVCLEGCSQTVGFAAIHADKCPNKGNPHLVIRLTAHEGQQIGPERNAR